jgi:L-ascorbate metabolism protein UlaG (beta-lactamase superfamily)
MKITFYGHASIELKYGKHVLVDPFISANPLETY